MSSAYKMPTSQKSKMLKKTANKLSLGARIELKMVTAWQQQAAWLWLLLPISVLYRVITFINRKLYQHHVLKAFRAPVPVMVIGNITVGGSGKTPLLVELVNYLHSQSIAVGVISRGYGGNEANMPCLVTEQSRPSQVGDEPCLIVRETGVPMSVCPNRQLAIECLLQHAPETDLIIADDGLQHFKLARDIEWIVVDSARGFGNKQLLPVGFLREPVSRLKDATVVYHQPISSIDTASPSRLTMALAPNSLTCLQFPQLAKKSDNNKSSEDGIHRLANLQTVYAVSGIGYPQRFFNTLRELGYNVVERPMPDHHEFEVNDLVTLTTYPIIITTKDAVKIAPLLSNNKALSALEVWVLPVRAVLSNECYETLRSQLKQFSII